MRKKPRQTGTAPLTASPRQSQRNKSFSSLISRAKRISFSSPASYTRTITCTTSRPEHGTFTSLQAVLLSGVTRLFVATYSTKMHGGFLRFQAQYLRRIRLPYWHNVPEGLRTELKEAAKKRDLQACNQATFKLYGLSREERAALGDNGE